LSTITAILPDNFEFHCFKSLICSNFKMEVLWLLKCPKCHIWLNVGPFDNWSAPSESRPIWRSYFVTTLKFCIDRPCGFLIYQGNHFFIFYFVCLSLLHGPPFWVFSPSRHFFFGLSRFFRFATYRVVFFIYVSNFCLDRPFGFSVHRDAHFCISRLLRFATYQAVFFWQSISWLHRCS